MKIYLDLLGDVLENGIKREDRTGVGTLSLFGKQLRFDLSTGFPLLTTKKVHFKSIVYELLWFLKGDTNVKYLNDNGVTIWNEWADADGNLGNIYGKQWRSWKGRSSNKDIDQISWVINEIKNNPTSRRLVVNSWNVADLENMALTPCHCLFQFYVSNRKLSCHLYQRSGDIFLGVPFNIASYALLTKMVAQVCSLDLGEFIHTFGDIHLYRNHIEQAREQLRRNPYPLPNIKLNPRACTIDNFIYEDFTLIDYKHHLPIKAKVAI